MQWQISLPLSDYPYLHCFGAVGYAVVLSKPELAWPGVSAMLLLLEFTNGYREVVSLCTKNDMVWYSSRPIPPYPLHLPAGPCGSCPLAGRPSLSSRPMGHMHGCKQVPVQAQQPGQRSSQHKAPQLAPAATGLKSSRKGLLRWVWIVWLQWDVLACCLCACSSAR